MTLAVSTGRAGPNEFVDRAQEHAIAEARASQAEKLAAEGKCGVARAVFQESLAHERTPRALLGVGDCFLELGMTASAWGAFHDAELGAAGQGDPARAATAHRRIIALEPRLAKMEIVVEQPDVEVSIDDVPKPPTSWGIAFPVDPGEHVVFARAPGKLPYSKTFEVASPGTTRIAIPELSAPPPPAPSAPPISESYVPEPLPARANLRPLGWTLIVTGLVGMETALVIGCLGTSACPSSGAPSRPVSLSPGVVVGTLVGGLVVSPALIAGGWRILTADDKRKKGGLAAAATPTIAPLVLPRGGGLALRGAF